MVTRGTIAGRSLTSRSASTTSPPPRPDPAAMDGRSRQREVAMLLARAAIRLEGRILVDELFANHRNPLDGRGRGEAPCDAAVDGRKSQLGRSRREEAAGGR